MNKATALPAMVLALQGCSYSYPIWATMVGNRLAFESGDRSYDCFTNIRVSATGPMARDPAIEAIEDAMERGKAEERRRTAWETDAVQTYECKGDFPVVYGAPMPGITVVEAKKLRIGIAYEVSTFGPKGTGGHGCFRINPDLRPENLPDQDCAYYEPPPPPAPAPAGTIVSPPQPRRDLAALIGPADYPASALSQRQEGIVAVALDVGLSGRVEGCAVERSSGSSALDAATCRLLRSRARFTPAMDDAGNPAPDRVQQEIVWNLPGGGGAVAASPPAQVTTFPGVPGGMVSNSRSAPPVVTRLPTIPATPINAMPPPDKSGPAQMYLLTPYRGIERWLRTYPSLGACERARAKLPKEKADRRLCGLGPRRPLF